MDDPVLTEAADPDAGRRMQVSGPVFFASAAPILAFAAGKDVPRAGWQVLRNSPGTVPVQADRNERQPDGDNGRPSRQDGR